MPPAGVALALDAAGRYVAPDGVELTLRAQGSHLILIDAGVPLEIRPVGQHHFALDGRIAGEETMHPSSTLEMASDGTLRWKDRVWRRADEAPTKMPAELTPHLGDYDPAIMPTRLSVSNGQLRCLIENLSPHECEPLGNNRFLMHGPMYERELLELGVLDEAGRPAIRIGAMILSKRDP